MALIGAAGHGNLGDDFIAHAAHSHISQFYPDAIVLAGSRNRLTVPTKSQSRLKFLLSDYDKVIIGGGGLFNDHWSLRYLRYFASVATAQRARGGQLHIAGVGVEPIKTRTGAGLLRLILRLSHTISLRDQASVEICEDLLPRRAFELGEDLAWLYRPNVTTASAESLVVTFAGEQAAQSLQRSQMLEQALSKSHLARFSSLEFLAMQRQDDNLHDDAMELNKLSAVLGYGKVTCPLEFAGAMSAISRAKMLVGFRLHAGVMAALLGVPTIMVARSNKVNWTLRDLPGVVILNSQADAWDFNSAIETLANPDWQLHFRNIESRRKAAAATLDRILAA